MCRVRSWPDFLARKVGVVKSALLTDFTLFRRRRVSRDRSKIANTGARRLFFDCGLNVKIT
jgi:hypothetical protein